MIDKLPAIRKALDEAKGERGRLTRIALDCDLSYRTIYTIMNKPEKKQSASTVDKLDAYFKKLKRKEEKHGRQQEAS